LKSIVTEGAGELRFDQVLALRPLLPVMVKAA